MNGTRSESEIRDCVISSKEEKLFDFYTLFEHFCRHLHEWLEGIPKTTAKNLLSISPFNFPLWCDWLENAANFIPLSFSMFNSHQKHMHVFHIYPVFTLSAFCAATTKKQREKTLKGTESPESRLSTWYAAASQPFSLPCYHYSLLSVKEPVFCLAGQTKVRFPSRPTYLFISL